MEQLPQDIQTPLLSSLSDIFELGRLSLVNKGYNQLVQHLVAASEEARAQNENLSWQQLGIVI
jgi:hypothetical protein